jgi:Leucine-rich repeat (LRR) protein
VLYEFENLEILYLHANHISNIKEVDKFVNLKKLKKLTLHANEIEKEKVIELNR